MMFRLIPLVLLAALAGLTISLIDPDGGFSNTDVLPILIPIILISLVFGLLQGIKRQKDIFNSYTLILDEEKITRQQNLTPDITIPFSGIKEIIKSKDGAIVIIGDSQRNVISIPVQLERIDELELKLAEIAEVSYKDPKPFIQKFSGAFISLVLALMMIIFMSENKTMVGIAGVSLTTGLIYGLIITQSSKYVDRKSKRGAWLLIIVILSVIGITYGKVVGGN